MKKKLIKKALKKSKDKKIFKFEKKLDERNFKKRKNCWIAIILKESKDAVVVYIPNKYSRFSVDSNVYFNTAKGKYLNSKSVICVYLEGVILPVDHSYIQYETIYNLFVDGKGQNVKDTTSLNKSELAMLDTYTDGAYIFNDNGFLVSTVSEQIKGLEFDSKTSDVLFESNLTDRMAMDKGDRALPLLTVLNFLILGCVIAGLVLTYYLGS